MRGLPVKKRGSTCSPNLVRARPPAKRLACGFSRQPWPGCVRCVFRPCAGSRQGLSRSGGWWRLGPTRRAPGAHAASAETDGFASLTVGYSRPAQSLPRPPSQAYFNVGIYRRCSKLTFDGHEGRCSAVLNAQLG